MTNCTHDSVVKLELIQVIKDFCTVETADGTKVGRDWKVVKSEYVSWQETITWKQHDLHDEHKINQPAGTFTERSMQRSQQSWVKTYMEDITDSSGRNWFDNLTWFTKKLCSVMTSVSVSEHMWNIGNKNVVTWDSQTAITEPEPVHGRTGCRRRRRRR